MRGIGLCLLVVAVVRSQGAAISSCRNGRNFSTAELQTKFFDGLPEHLNTLAQTSVGLRQFRSLGKTNDKDDNNAVDDPMSGKNDDSLLCPHVQDCSSDYDETRTPKQLCHFRCKFDVDPLGMFECKTIQYEITVLHRRTCRNEGEKVFSNQTMIDVGCVAQYATDGYQQLDAFLSKVGKKAPSPVGCKNQ